MSEPVQTSPCPFVAKLVAMLLESRAASPDGRAPSIFARLIDLETEARRQQACEHSRHLIARVRRISGTATVIPFPNRPEIAHREARTLR